MLIRNNFGDECFRSFQFGVRACRHPSTVDPKFTAVQRQFNVSSRDFLENRNAEGVTELKSFRNNLIRLAYGSPLRTAVTRFLISAVATIGIARILPMTSLGNSGGIVAFGVLVICAWYLGIGPAIVSPMLLVLSFRFRGNGFHQLFALSSKDLFDIFTITVVMTSVGVAGALRRRAQAIADQRADQLKEQDRHKDEFLATLAHELRNPLAPIRMGLEVMEMLEIQCSDPTAFLDVKRMMRRQVDHMVRLIDDLLDVSRIKTGKLVIRPEALAIAVVINDAIEAARADINAARHELTVTTPAEPILVNVDRVRMTQVIVNLLNNAAKFTPPGGQIELRAQRLNGTLEIRVRDSGIGISRELLPKVFNLFVQAEDLLTRTHGGLGIGLSLVHRLMELHGGNVQAFSEGPGLGSEFVLTLPCTVQPTTAATSTKPQTEELLTRRILVVDDNQDAAKTLAMMLSAQGHQCDIAFDGFAALKTAQKFQPEVFFLDLGMPAMSGFELAAKLRALDDFKSSLLIAVTGWGRLQDRVNCLNAGFDEHLVKPIEVEKVRQLLNSRRPIPSSN